MKHEQSKVVYMEHNNQPSVKAQASQWLARLESDEVSREDRQAFAVWLQADPSHRDEFERLKDLWGDMNILTQIRRPKPQPSLSFGQWLPMASALCVLVLLAFMVLPLEQTDNFYTTAVGEQRELTLADGTVVLLNTDSALKVDYTPERRSLYLVRGEAHFDVFHDPLRPLEVSAESGLVRAIGTAFSVRIKEVGIVDVLVTDGVVEIESVQGLLPVSVSDNALPNKAQPPIKSPPKVSAGNVFTIDGASVQAAKPVAQEVIARRLSWQQGMLNFQGEALVDVVEEVGRYTPVEIIITDSAARQLRVGGYFKVGDTEALFEALERGFGVKVNKVDNQLVYLSMAE